MNSSFNLTVSHRLGIFIGSDRAHFESDRAQRGHDHALTAFERARVQALGDLAKARRELEGTLSAHGGARHA